MMSLESSKKWILPDKTSTLESVVEDLFDVRGLNKDDIKSFLNPTLESIPSWKKLYGAKKAAKQIINAVKEGKKVFIHGDFDVDGVSATAILWEFLYREVSDVIGKSLDVTPYIPDRVDEGYGLSPSSVDSMLEQGAQMIVTVDCGVRDRKIIEEYMEKTSCEFIVTDHHQPPEDINDVPYTIVHQMFPKKEYPETRVCGAFVAFLLTNAIRSELGVEDVVKEDSSGLDLVALATVADMMPLVGVNRSVVKYGLEQMKKCKRLGLKSLCDISGIDSSVLDSYHLGFVIGPRINAAGRIGSAMDALRLMVTNKSVQANILASSLHNLNVKRQEQTSEIFNIALKDISSDDSLLFLSGDNWHEGVIGLVAGKLLERFNRPVVVVTKVEDGSYKGSARSVVGFNITDAISNFSDLLERYGGHAQAAGFTVKPNELEKFRKKLLSFATNNLSKDMLESTLEVDLRVEPNTISIELCEKFESLKPFGYGNSTPLVYLENIKIKDKFIMKGGQHMRLTLDNDIKAVMFNCADDVEVLNVDDTIDLVGNVNINEWKGYRNVQFQVKGWRSV